MKLCMSCLEELFDKDTFCPKCNNKNLICNKELQQIIEDPLRHAGPCVGGHYPGHLHPRHRGYADRGGGQDRPWAGQRGTGGIRSGRAGLGCELPAGAGTKAKVGLRVHHPDQ